MVFSIEDARQASGKNYPAALHTLRRLAEAGWGVRLNPGKYAIVPLEAGDKAIPAAKRPGYLLELFELASGPVLEGLRDLVGPSYAPLDPLLPAEGRYLARWRLRINLDPEALISLVTT